MFVVSLTFSANKAMAPRLLAGHNAWLARGFEAGVFLLAGSLAPGAGGAILAHNLSREALEALVQDDPFVAADVVAADILEIAPVRTDDRLAFLRA